MTNGTVDTQAALQRIIDAAQSDDPTESAIAEFKKIHKEWLNAVGEDKAGQEQVRQAVRWLWEHDLPEASTANRTISNALERTIGAVRGCQDER